MKIKAVFYRKEYDSNDYKPYRHKLTHVPSVGDRVSGYFVHRDAVWFVVTGVEWLKDYVYIYVEYIPQDRLR